MTADELFNIVIGLMFAQEDEKPDYTPYIPMLNIILAETFSLNNALRDLREKEPLLKLVTVSGLTDEIPYEEDILYKVIPYGVAGLLYAEDDDTGLGSYYRQKYEAAKAEITTAKFEEAEFNV